MYTKTHYDSVVQVIRRDGQLALSELTYGAGLLAGSTGLDDMFQKHVRELFGPQDFDTWLAENPQMFSKLKHKTWEDAKKAFDNTQDVIIDLPGRVVRSLSDEVTSMSTVQRLCLTECTVP